MQRGQSTLEWVIGAAVILGTLATQRDRRLKLRVLRAGPLVGRQPSRKGELGRVSLVPVACLVAEPAP
jgi:hypothetical protein